MGTRDERVADLYYLDLGPTDPSEEGQSRRVGNDLRVYIDGEVRSLLTELPDPVHSNVVFYSDDGTNFKQVTLLTSRRGVMTNDHGELVYQG